MLPKLQTYTVPEHLPCQVTSFPFSSLIFSRTNVPSPVPGNSVFQPSLLDLLSDCNLSTTCAASDQINNKINHHPWSMAQREQQIVQKGVHIVQKSVHPVVDK